jgi:hypothetical protein
MLLAVVDVAELNEIDLAAAPAKAASKIASAVVEQRKDPEKSAITSIVQVLAMLGGILAAASLFRAVRA